MNPVGSFPDALTFAAKARLKLFGGRAALAGDVRDANPTTGDRLARLAITESFIGNEYVLFVLADKVTGECEHWAYVEKVGNGHEILFAFGRGNVKAGMRISECATVKIDPFDNLRFDVGGEMEDDGQEVKLVKHLDDLAFSSRISELNGDAGHHKRTSFSGLLSQLPADAGADGTKAAASPATPASAGPSSAKPAALVPSAAVPAAPPSPPAPVAAVPSPPAAVLVASEDDPAEEEEEEDADRD